MPNTPLPTPTIPAPPKPGVAKTPSQGVVPQGAMPQVAATANSAPVAPASKPAPQPVAAPVVKPPTTSTPSTKQSTPGATTSMPTPAVKPTTVVTPGQVKPPVASVSAPTTSTASPTATTPAAKPNAVIGSSATVKPTPQSATPNQATKPSAPVAPAQQVAQPTSVAPATPPPTIATKPAVAPQPAAVAQPVAASLPANTAKPVMPAKPVTPAPVVTPPAAGLPKPGQVAGVGSAGPVGVPGSTPSATSQTLPTSTTIASGQPAPSSGAAVKKPPAALFAVIGVVLLAIVGFVAFSVFGKSNSSSSSGSAEVASDTTNTGSSTPETTKKPATPAKQTTITYWGLWEPTEIMAQVIADFETANPQFKIDYRKQSHKDYRERLQTAIASGNGPDVFRFHASWTPMLANELAVMPSSVMSDAQYKQTYYPVAAKLLSIKSRIVGIPLMYDGLALFYNEDILKTANAQPPQNWAELRSLADALTVPSDKVARSSTPLQRSGLAIGNAENVEHFSDILGLLILQNGGDLTKPNSPEVRDALLFYTNFLKEDMVWSEALPSSTVAFARGDAAMMLAPSWRVHDIKNLNPALNFGVAPAPKLGDTRLGWASFWAEGVNSKSKNQDGAWLFLKHLSQPEVLKKFYADASTVRTFGELYPRQDMVKELSSDPITSQFLADAPTADSWYLNSYTHDNGLNDQLIKYYKDAINGVIKGQTIEEVLETLDSGTTQVLRQYNADSD